MPAKKNTKKKQPADPGKAVPDPVMEQIYDVLMAQIEPELTSYMIPFLDGLYGDETDEERKLRGERYAKALALYNQKFAELLGQWVGAIQTFKKEAMRAHGKQEQETDEDALSDISRSIASS